MLSGASSAPGRRSARTAGQREGRATGGATAVPESFEEPLEEEDGDEEAGCVFATTRGLAASRPCCCCWELGVDAVLVSAFGGGVWRWRAARGADEELEPPLDAPDPVCTTHAEVERTANENAITPSCFIVPSYEPKFGGGVSPEFSKTASCSLDISGRRGEPKPPQAPATGKSKRKTAPPSSPRA